MADVQAVFGTLLALGIVFPGLLMTWWLLFPNLVTRAENRIAHNPWWSFFVGLGVAIFFGLPSLVLAQAGIPFANFTAAAAVLGALAFAGLGAAGLTSWIALRLINRSNSGLSQSAAFLRSAVLLELAAAFPLIGWFIFIPLVLTLSLGAATLALFKRRPRPVQQPMRETQTQTAESPITIQIEQA